MADKLSKVKKEKITSPKESAPEEVFDLSKSADIIRLLRTYKDNEPEIRTRFKKDIANFIASAPVSADYQVLFLYDSEGSVADYDLNRIYDSIIELGPKAKNLLLVIHSNGGSIEPAYLISKLCKEFGKKFVVAIPRKAKSAATLVSLGADEIHMGAISHLGPIDPQIGGRPALGLGNALEYLAGLVTKHPKSSEMFAKYLNFELDLKQLGYFERVTESAVQYAERLLTDKKLPEKFTANAIAKDFTYSFKDHGFVIDRKEASVYLGDSIKCDTPEIKFAEQLFNRINNFDLYLGTMRKQQLVVSGSIEKGGLFFAEKKED